MMSQRFKNALVDTMLVGSVVLLIAFFYAPIVTLVAFSFTSSRVLTFPIEGFSLEWYGELVRKPDFLPPVPQTAPGLKPPSRQAEKPSSRAIRITTAAAA